MAKCTTFKIQKDLGDSRFMTLNKLLNLLPHLLKWN